MGVGLYLSRGVFLLCFFVLGCASQRGRFDSSRDDPSFQGTSSKTEVSALSAKKAPQLLDYLQEKLNSSGSCCQDWNPEFLHRGRRCCSMMKGRHRRQPFYCAKSRRRSGALCSEQTDFHREFSSEWLNSFTQEEIPKDSLSKLEAIQSSQAYCHADNGFLAFGIPLTEGPGLRLMSPGRCAYFGTLGLSLLLTRLAQTVANTSFSLLVGDMSAPRGGCLPTPRGAHRGHTNGLDVDLGFFNQKELLVQRDQGIAPRFFSRKFEPESNLWLLRRLKQMSPVCIEAIFLDHRWIASLKQRAHQEKLELEDELFKVLRHMKGHRNHFHIRVGVKARGAEDPLSCRDIQTSEKDEDEDEEDLTQS